MTRTKGSEAVAWEFEKGLSDRYFTSQDIPVKEVTSSPPNGPEDSDSDFCPPQFSHQPRRFFWGGGRTEEAHSARLNLLMSPIRRAGGRSWSPPPPTNQFL